MKKRISVTFTDYGKIFIELDESQSLKTVDNLPIEIKINRWGDELYTDKTPIVAEEENAQSIVNLLDVAYWPEGNAPCLFYGPTPISESPDKILPYSPVNVVGKIISEEDILYQIRDGNKVVIQSE
jgi:uncharacterized protein